MTKAQLIWVEGVDSEVPCPRCETPMRKLNHPTKPMPGDPSNGTLLKAELGRANCDTCQEGHPWCIRN